MSYITTPLDELLMEYSIGGNEVLEKSALPHTIMTKFMKQGKNIKPTSINGISDTEFLEVYLDKLIQEYKMIYPKLSSILKSQKHKKFAKAYQLCSKSELDDQIDTLRTNIKMCLSSEGHVALPMINWELHKVLKNPREYTPEQDLFWECYRSITNDISQLISDKLLFIIDDGGDWDEGVIRLVLNKTITVVTTESYMVIRPTSKVKPGDSGFYYDGIYNSIRWFNKKPYRDRVETLVIKDNNKVFIRWIDDNPDIKYTIPGGGTDLDSSPIKQAENETNEEAVIDIKNITDSGINYMITYSQSKKNWYPSDFPIKYTGCIAQIFVAEYKGPFTGHIEEYDLDEKMAKEGKFVPIADLVNILRDEHKQALINSTLISDECRLTLMGSQLTESGEVYIPDTELTDLSNNVKLCIGRYNSKVDEIYDRISSNNTDLESNIYNHRVRFIELNNFVKDIAEKEPQNMYILHLFIIHLNKQINEARFNYRANKDEAIKQLWLEFDQWLTKLRDDITSLEKTVITTQPIQNSKDVYYLSESDLDNRVLIPKVENSETSLPFHEKPKPTINFFKTINGALMSSCDNIMGKVLNVYEPVNKKNITIPTDPISKLTGRVWITDPVKVKRVGSITIGRSFGKSICTEAANGIDLYNWEWSWSHGSIKESFTPIMESPILHIVMEAKPADELEDDPTDYTDVEEEEDEETGSEEDPDDSEVDVDDEPTDYTDVEEEGEESEEDPEETSEEDIDNAEPENTGDENPVSDDEEQPTDYSQEDDANAPTDNEDPSTEDPNGSTEDGETTDTSEDNNDGDIKIKNKFLLKDFNNLHLTLNELIDDLETTVYSIPTQNSGLAQVLKNMNKIEDFVVMYIQNHFDLTDYTSNLYYYNIAMQSLKINCKMLEKIQELDSNNKQIDKK